MKKVTVIALLMMGTSILSSCDKSTTTTTIDSHDNTTINNNGGNGTGNGNNTNGNNTTPLTLVNVKVGDIVFYAGDTNRHWTVPVQGRPIKMTKYKNPLTISWECSQKVKTSVTARITDLTYNQYTISNAQATNVEGVTGSATFSPNVAPGTYILTVTVTLLGDTHSYEYIYPICVEQ